MLPLRSAVTAIIACVPFFFLTVARAKVYDRCELARELRNFDVNEEEIPTWVCIAKYESLFDTAAMNPGSGDHGLFQISQLFWCSPPGNGFGCNTPCEKFRDDDISDDLQCIKRIFNEHKRFSGDGYNAWAVYPLYCKGDTTSYIEGCFDGSDVENQLNSTQENQPNPEDNDEDDEGYDFPPLPSFPRHRSQLLGNDIRKNQEEYAFNTFKNVDTSKHDKIQETSTELPKLTTMATNVPYFNTDNSILTTTAALHEELNEISGSGQNSQKHDYDDDVDDNDGEDGYNFPSLPSSTTYRAEVPSIMNHQKEYAFNRLNKMPVSTTSIPMQVHVNGVNKSRLKTSLTTSNPLLSSSFTKALLTFQTTTQGKLDSLTLKQNIFQSKPKKLILPTLKPFTYTEDSAVEASPITTIKPFYATLKPFATTKQTVPTAINPYSLKQFKSVTNEQSDSSTTTFKPFYTTINSSATTWKPLIGRPPRPPLPSFPPPPLFSKLPTRKPPNRNPFQNIPPPPPPLKLPLPFRGVFTTKKPFYTDKPFFSKELHTDLESEKTSTTEKFTFKPFTTKPPSVKPFPTFEPSFTKQYSTGPLTFKPFTKESLTSLKPFSSNKKEESGTTATTEKFTFKPFPFSPVKTFTTRTPTVKPFATQPTSFNPFLSNNSSFSKPIPTFEPFTTKENSNQLFTFKSVPKQFSTTFKPFTSTQPLTSFFLDHKEVTERTPGIEKLTLKPLALIPNKGLTTRMSTVKSFTTLSPSVKPFLLKNASITKPISTLKPFFNSQFSSEPFTFKPFIKQSSSTFVPFTSTTRPSTNTPSLLGNNKQLTFPTRTPLPAIFQHLPALPNLPPLPVFPIVTRKPLLPLKPFSRLPINSFLSNGMPTKIPPLNSGNNRPILNMLNGFRPFSSALTARTNVYPENNLPEDIKPKSLKVLELPEGVNVSQPFSSNLPSPSILQHNFDIGNIESKIMLGDDYIFYRIGNGFRLIRTKK